MAGAVGTHTAGKTTKFEEERDCDLQKEREINDCRILTNREESK